jgi:hypothetical protein
MFNIGDRVKELGRDCYRDEPIEIISTLKENKRYHLKYLNVFNVQGTNMLFWVHEDDIILDKEYYRDKKINEVLN